MTYDMLGSSIPGSSSSSGNYHASLAKVRQAVEELLHPGVGLERTPQKVLLGIPAYARHLRDPSQVKTFGEIYDSIIQRSDDDMDDSSLHSWKGYEWESPARIQAKIDLAKEMQLGGIFFWELGQDKCTNEHPSGILFDTAVAAASVGGLSSSSSSSSSREKSKSEGTTEL